MFEDAENARTRKNATRQKIEREGEEKEKEKYKDQLSAKNLTVRRPLKLRRSSDARAAEKYNIR